MAHLLIVDDEPQVRSILTRVTKAAGHDSREASCWDEALAAMAEAPADVVLCDIEMPGEHDGVWLTNELRRRYAGLPVVLITGVDTVPPATSLQDGVIAYILKPFSQRSVLGAIERALTWQHDSLAAAPKNANADFLAAWFEGAR